MDNKDVQAVISQLQAEAEAMRESANYHQTLQQESDRLTAALGQRRDTSHREIMRERYASALAYSLSAVILADRLNNQYTIGNYWRGRGAEKRFDVEYLFAVTGADLLYECEGQDSYLGTLVTVTRNAEGLDIVTFPDGTTHHELSAARCAAFDARPLIQQA